MPSHYFLFTSFCYNSIKILLEMYNFSYVSLRFQWKPWDTQSQYSAAVPQNIHPENSKKGVLFLKTGHDLVFYLGKKSRKPKYSGGFTESKNNNSISAHCIIVIPCWCSGGDIEYYKKKDVCKNENSAPWPAIITEKVRERGQLCTPFSSSHSWWAWDTPWVRLETAWLYPFWG